MYISKPCILELGLKPDLVYNPSLVASQTFVLFLVHFVMVRLPCHSFQQELWRSWGSWGSRGSQGFRFLGRAKITQVNMTWNWARSFTWPHVMMREGNSNQVDYAREGSFRGFGKPHAFLIKVYQRPVFTKRTSLRLILWSQNTIYTVQTEGARMFKGDLVDV